MPVVGGGKRKRQSEGRLGSKPEEIIGGILVQKCNGFIIKEKRS